MAGQCYDGTMATLRGMKVHDGASVITEKLPVLRFVGMSDWHLVQFLRLIQFWILLTEMRSCIFFGTVAVMSRVERNNASSVTWPN